MTIHDQNDNDLDNFPDSYQKVGETGEQLQPPPQPIEINDALPHPHHPNLQPHEPDEPDSDARYVLPKLKTLREHHAFTLETKYSPDDITEEASNTPTTWEVLHDFSQSYYQRIPELAGYDLARDALQQAGVGASSKIEEAKKRMIEQSISREVLPVNTSFQARTEGFHEAVQLALDDQPEKLEAYFIGRLALQVEAASNLRANVPSYMKVKNKNEGDLNQARLQNTASALKQHPSCQTHPEIAQLAKTFDYLTSSEENALHTRCVLDPAFCKDWLGRIDAHLKGNLYFYFTKETYLQFVTNPGAQSVSRNQTLLIEIKKIKAQADAQKSWAEAYAQHSSNPPATPPQSFSNQRLPNGASADIATICAPLSQGAADRLAAQLTDTIIGTLDKKTPVK